MIRFISGRKASPTWVTPTRVATEKTSRLLSSYSRLNMPAKDKAVVKCVASILVSRKSSPSSLSTFNIQQQQQQQQQHHQHDQRHDQSLADKLLILWGYLQTSFWQSEDLVIRQQEPPM